MRPLVAVASVLLASCAGAPPPGLTAKRESGQSGLMNQTLAGQKCDPKDHGRPFVIEWDATDISSFESRANTDVIFVRYHDCKLEVVDTCTNESVRGSLGAYQPIDWTSGAVEKIDILNEGELFLKLPLGVALLGARVGAGEQFHMEYFVAGTRKATRAAVFRGDLTRLPGCRGVTHYVYAYNLGAFALGSLTKTHTEAGVTIWGVGGGGELKYQNAIEKQGGLLGSCRGQSASEVLTCKTPIRLTLREVEEGDNPDLAARAAPETPDAMNLAGKLQQQGEKQSEAGEHQRSAQTKLGSGDGKGCLAELDLADKLAGQASNQSTNPKSYLAMTRAQCLMLAGQCDAGRSLWRRGYEATAGSQLGPQQIDGAVDGIAGMYCRGAMSPRDTLLRGLMVLQQGSYQNRESAANCARAFEDAMSALPKVKPRDADDKLVEQAPRRFQDSAARCLARAGDCKGAWKAYQRMAELVMEAERHTAWKTPQSMRSSFVSTTRMDCLDKDQGSLTPVEAAWRAIEELGFSDNEAHWTSATCRSVLEKGERAIGSLGPKDDLRPILEKLGETASHCFAKAGDCSAAYAARVLMLKRADPANTEARAIVRFVDDSDLRSCREPLPAKLSPREQVLYANAALDRATWSPALPVKACRALSETVIKGLAALPADDELKRVRSEYGRHAARCFAENGACDDAWQVFREAESAKERPPPEAEIRKHFDSSFDKCRSR